LRQNKLLPNGALTRRRERLLKFFSDLLGITFDLRYDIIEGKKSIKLGDREIPREKVTTEHVDVDFEQSTQRVAIGPGLELIQAIPPLEKEGLRSFHLKVSDLEGAKAEMEAKGVRRLCDINYPHIKEAIFGPDDLHGARLCLLEYDAPTAVDAVLKE